MNVKVDVDYRAIPLGVNMLKTLWHRDPNNSDLDFDYALVKSVEAVCVAAGGTLKASSSQILSKLSDSALDLWGNDRKNHKGDLATRPWFHNFNLHMLLFPALGVINRSRLVGEQGNLPASESSSVNDVACEYARAALKSLGYDSTGYLGALELVPNLSKRAVSIVKHYGGYSITHPVHLRNALDDLHYFSRIWGSWGPKESEQLTRFYRACHFDKLDNDVKERYLIVLLSAWAACQADRHLPLLDYEVRDPYIGLVN